MNEPKQKTEINDDYAVAKNQWHRFKRAYERGHEKYMVRAKKCADFYVGEQWDEKDRAALEAQGRPALTINTVLSTVNTVLGEQSMNRMEISFKPRKTGNSDTAEALTKLFMQISDSNRLDDKEGEIFADAIIEDGRGYYDARINFDGNINGEVDVEVVDPKDIVLSPDAKEYDPKTWDEVFRHRLMSLEEVESTYGKDAAAKLKEIGINGDQFERLSMLVTEDRFGDDSEQGAYQGAYGDESDRRTVKLIRVVERQYKKIQYAQCFIDLDTGDTQVVPSNWDVARVEEFRHRMGLGVLKKIMPRVRWTVTADQVVLHDDWSPYRTFSIVPYFAYFRRGRPFGLVTNLLSPQEQLNKVSSQELHIVNTTANSGWIAEDGTLVNMDEDDLAQRGAETGLVIIHARGSAPPQKIQPNQIPTGLDRIGMKAANNIREISGVNEGMLGNGSPEVSGVAMEKKEARGQVQIQVPLDNLAKSRRFLAHKILELVQDYYTDARIFRITDEIHPDQPEMELGINQPQEDGSILNDLTLGEYDVVVSTQPARDNFGDVQFAEAISLREIGVQIPDHIIIEYSHLARKKDIAAQVKELTGLNPPSPEELEMLQLQQQMQIDGARLELEKLEAEAMEIQSRAQLNTAKAEQAGSDSGIRMKEISTKLQSKREELSVRIQLAQMTNRVKQQGLGAQMLIAHNKPAPNQTPQASKGKK